jgi:hypothetical protein
MQMAETIQLTIKTVKLVRQVAMRLIKNEQQPIKTAQQVSNVVMQIIKTGM